MKTFKEIIEYNQLSIPSKAIYIKLDESFNVTKTEYGNNYPELNNRKFTTINGTYFNIGNQIVQVLPTKVDSKTVYFKFRTSSDNRSLSDNNFKVGDDYSSHNANALTIFNKALFVLFEYTSKNNITEIVFEGISFDLKRVYSTITKNKRILNNFKKYGWEYSHSEKDTHVFKKV